MNKVESIQSKLFRIFKTNGPSLSVILGWTDELHMLSNYKIIKVLSELSTDELSLLESIYCRGQNLTTLDPERFKVARIALEDHTMSSSSESDSTWSNYSSSDCSVSSASSMISSVSFTSSSRSSLNSDSTSTR